MRRNLGYAIALAALLISIPRYVAVFAGIDTVSLTAYGMGILLAGGAAYIVDAWADATNRRVKQPTHRLLIVLAVNLAYEPILLTPFVLSRLWSKPLADVMSTEYAVFWSVMVTLAPVLLVFGVVYAVWFHKQPAQPELNKETRNAPLSAHSEPGVFPSAQRVQTIDTYAQVPTFRYKRDHVSWLHEQEPELTVTQLAQRVGCSKGQASRALRRNGNHETV